jgi:UDP-N-acetylglucosamine diphosphorylase/glucosamine-1-phosphate N-acetyltransferase
MNFVLCDEDLHWKNFLPLTFTRPVSEIRIGILTLKQKWDKYLGQECSYHTQAYLSEKFPMHTFSEGVFIQSSVLPDVKLCQSILALKHGEGLFANGRLIAWCGQLDDQKKATTLKTISYTEKVVELNQVWDIFQKNADAITNDCDLICQGRTSQKLSDTVTVIGDKNLVFLEEGAKAEACVLNTTAGPIYLGIGSEIMEGCAVRGPFALGEQSTLKLGTKVYGATTIGPHCKVGGEISNSVIFGYSNKAHDGFLGNSVLGEWCNLGADTNTSNLKNNYGHVKLFNYTHNKQIDTGLQFCGLIMGDHSKSGINTMFNTGTVVGIASNIYGGGFPATAIANFSWGGSEGFENYHLDKLFETAEKVYERRGMKFDEKEKKILTAVKKFYS